ncbi:hypothetical protein FRACA_140066 [Frankia canadensis]|uniref:ChsH2 C-terminal OB-fold domain-containing protein n=1 Tax=Frankia canadensis TaxID=1836972 RepID=A0A2I2KLF0_9ACTN|nr:OB-fold domain-containing protein [Frankia canadensis]SNQ46467.1 hypothetical protein FRACA_140066 [Frankia canadensis]SOU53757.1 hypothetical protein FRACA_140066 [Frankia canadensis]
MTAVLAARPLDDDLVAPFWRGIGAGRLLLPRCSSCGGWEWYPSPAGPACAGAHYDWTETPARGTVFTFTRVHHGFPGMNLATPFTVGLVEPVEAPGVRLVSRLADTPDAPLAIGAAVRMKIVDDDLGLRAPLFVLDDQA